MNSIDSVTRSQVSSANPGWIGPGVPSLRTLALARPREVARDLLRGRVRRAWNSSIATAADLWNFHGPVRRHAARTCPCCTWSGPAFLAASNWRAVAFQSRCPNCDARSRHRGLLAVLPEALDSATDGPLLLFAPERVLLNFLRTQPAPRRIVTTDYNSTDVDYPGQDIQRLTFPDASFAMLLCNHVLEHVPDDRAATAECARVLMPGGLALFTVPGDFPAPKTRVFSKPDDNGHLRHYGMDLLDVLRRSFRSVEAIEMCLRSPRSAGVRRHDYVFWCEP